MSDTSLNKQFMGQARLVRLLLWKVGNSTDIDICLDTAVEKGMLNDEDADFLLLCMTEEETARESQSPSIDVDGEMILRLRRCVDKLNRADCA